VLLTASKSLLGPSEKGENKGPAAEVDELLRSIFAFDLGQISLTRVKNCCTRKGFSPLFEK
jgi:hypothetical protein